MVISDGKPPLFIGVLLSTNLCYQHCDVWVVFPKCFSMIPFNFLDLFVDSHGFARAMFSAQSASCSPDDCREMHRVHSANENSLAVLKLSKAHNKMVNRCKRCTYVRFSLLLDGRQVSAVYLPSGKDEREPQREAHSVSSVSSFFEKRFYVYPLSMIYNDSYNIL